MEGWWDVKDFEEFCFRLFKIDVEKAIQRNLQVLLLYLNAKLTNVQTRVRSKKVAQIHYNLSNDFYMLFLGPYNQYTSCYYPKGTESYEEAERARLDLICKKLQLTKADTVLDIGCGWGGFARFAAEKYGCHVTGISIAEEQIKFAQEFVKGLPVAIEYKDYRDLLDKKGNAQKKFTKIFSGGMLEHVGPKNYKQYMHIVKECLADRGIFLLDCLGKDFPQPPDPWSEKYIFPNSHIPSTVELTKSIEGIFIMEDWHNFGRDYRRTALEWFKRFDKNWDKIQKLDKKFDERFYRMWKFYLLGGAAKLRARQFQQWQIILSKGDLPDKYISTR